MRALLIDDERLARAELRRLLAAHPEVEIVGEAINAADGVQQIHALKPDLIFLDVQMPGGSGFDMLAALEEAPEVIFTTAFDQYALQAFEVNALDYLQKPIQAARMASALQRCAARHHREAASTASKKLFIKDGERCWFVALENIRLFESDGNYTRVYFDQHQPLMLRSLNQLEEKLDPSRFFRASRRHIVNLDHVEQAAPNDAGGLDLTLRDQVAIEVSRRRAPQFKALTSF
ncbi:two component transcriptional regulator, LytTR family [Duganella sp. CF402]|uniref:LytR/AlgR family response regulator transcription factor n=1 Tax=unclassified Duganella TaxID=2636909 RepID=UPI0008D60BF1|nr:MULTISPECIES: LytTR family DNA-binding domain-containing protein [unclassified Duganella]RZT01871.1 LytTR family two component transcriptional regulator [Duganella sp. BK701]SEN20559.1 two component transcriptional regulator, LytTR family [Duganella sp. CF402]